MALIELYSAPEGRYKQDVYLLPKKMGKSLNILQHLEYLYSTFISLYAELINPCIFDKFR